MHYTNDLCLDPSQLVGSRLGPEHVSSWRNQGYAFVDGLIPTTLI
jgi:hypothetical protein